MREGRKDGLQTLSGSLYAAGEVNYQCMPPGPTSRTAEQGTANGIG